MNLPSRKASFDKMDELLAYVRKKGIRVWSENGQLHYKAPKGALTREEMANLQQLLGRAASATAGEARDVSHPRLDRAPLAFSQVAHWNLYRLSERRFLRQTASAIRLTGKLKIDVLQGSITAIVRRHDALRTRIIVSDGVPIAQEIAESVDCELRVDDLTGVPEDLRDVEVNRIIEQFIIEPIDLTVGPVFGVRVLRLHQEEHVLIVLMDHIISDAFSMNILLRDLFTTYTQAITGQASALPAIPVQFADYAAWQRNSHKSWMEKHGAYWAQRLSGCQRVKFPVDSSVRDITRLGWNAVPLRIDRELKSDLHEWCRLRRTTLVMSTFTVYVGLVLRWCNVSDAVIQYQTNGRISPKIENTIGYFSSPLYLRMQLFERDSFIDLLDRTTDEYCKAYEHADSSYMESQIPRPEFTRNAAFNWIPKTPPLDALDLEDVVKCSPVPFEHPVLRDLERDTEPFLLLYDTEDEIVGGAYFPLNRFSFATMERFGRNYLMFIKELLRQPGRPVNDILLI